MQHLSDLAVVKDVLRRHGFHLSHSLGQNFLINPSVCPRMAQACGAGKTTGVLEIGPGIGVLTRELSAFAGKVAAVELDKRLLPVLSETLQDRSNVNIVQGDILKLDLHALLQAEFSQLDEVVVCSNLPYYITSPVIMRFLEERLPVKTLTLMVQKEAARRLCTKPGTRDCGAVSAAVYYYAQPEILFYVSRGSFFPAPQVDSAVIQLQVRDRPMVQPMSESNFFKLVKAAFAQRRKTLVNAVSAGLHLPKEQVAKAIARVGIGPKERPERLTIEEFAALSDELTKERNEPFA